MRFVWLRGEGVVKGVHVSRSHLPSAACLTLEFRVDMIFQRKRKCRQATKDLENARSDVHIIYISID